MNQLATFGELADALETLPVVLRATRRQRRLTVRAAAEEIGIAFSNVHRIEYGHGYQTSSAVAVLRWLDGGRPPTPQPTKQIELEEGTP